MMHPLRFVATACLLVVTTSAIAQERPLTDMFGLGPYLYEAKPDGEAFEKFHPRLAPPPGPMLLKPDDRLAIIGDSITEQKMYSRIIETYLTVCHPKLNISVRQYGWSGERTDGLLKRMDQDLFTGKPAPTIATLAYGMNDARYRPFDFNNGVWYRDHYAAIVQKLKAKGARVVVGSPGCAGKIATWVESRRGTLDEHNLHLCALRDIAIEVAKKQDVAFADMFWPMYVAQVTAAAKHGTPDDPYEVTGTDGIHPPWAGHVMMAYQFLSAMGVPGDIASIELDVTTLKASTSQGHAVEAFDGTSATIVSQRYPFCADGDVSDENTVRAGMELVPFNAKLNRFVLKVSGITADNATVTWGDASKTFTREQLAAGVNLADVFVTNPFTDPFNAVDEAVAAKQAFETTQVKQVLHGKRGKADFDDALRETEVQRDGLVETIRSTFKPVRHTITIE